MGMFSRGLIVACAVIIASCTQVQTTKTIDNGGSGPYAAIAATEASLPDYVVYRPKNLARAAEQAGGLPVVVFANGGCNDTSLPFERMLSEVASHGYIVIALGAMQNSLDDRPLNKSPNARMPEAIDWISAQTSNKHSDYHQAADLSNVAFAGQSCGGAQVLAMAADPRVKTYLMFNSGIGDMTMSEASRDSLQNVHGPIVYLIGGESDVAYPNAQLDYQRLDHVPVAFANAINGGHSGTFEEPNGGSFARMALKWLDWQLKDESGNAHVFLKSDLRNFPGWTMKAKNFSATQAEDMTTVKVEQGTLQGTLQETSEGNLAVFKGVPFAKPPVGELRWKAPRPAEDWEGVRKATQYAPAPMQAGNPPSGKSEDSLYLNIWTPAKSPKENIPVMVWIYGGGFSFGTSSDPLFDGTHLANKGVVVVTIAYRVGQLGFLAHPELSAESPHGVSGNYGLLDQIAALEWINKNITAFGGDPSNVTIFGESAGGISVSMLAASPVTKGLFQKAISQSGGSFGPTRTPNYPGENMTTLKRAEAEGVTYVKNFGASSIEELRAMGAEKFIPAGWSLPGGWPIVDGYVIPGDQFILYEQGKFNDVPVLVGYNSDEGVSFIWNDDPKQFVDGIDTRFGKFSPSLKEAYGVSNEKITRSARNLIRDAAFGWHTWSWARLQSENGDAPAYLYFFDQHPDYPKGSPKHGQGSPHGQDIAYVFKRLDTANPDVTAADVKMSEAIATYWTNFAKTGNPNGDGVPKWPAFNTKSPTVMYFQQQPKVGPVPDKEALEVLDDYFEWRRTPEGAKWADGQSSR